MFAQISNVQYSLEKYYFRVDVLEKALAYKEMTVEEREKTEAELAAIKEILTVQEESLKTLRAENRKTTSVAGLFIVLCIAVFLIYQVIVNPN